MLVFYRGLLYLYPRLYRHEYASEMISVFRQAHADISTGSFAHRFSFRVRETMGLLTGAIREHVRITCGHDQLFSFTRSDMRSEFRFPRSTVFLMSLLFCGVIVAMQKAHIIMMKYAHGEGSIWPSLPWFLAFTVVFTGAAALVVRAILFALGRTGTQRLANIRPDTAD